VNPKATIFQFQPSAMWGKVFFFDLGVSSIAGISYLFEFIFLFIFYLFNKKSNFKALEINQFNYNWQITNKGNAVCPT
jgi:hypothetical protein